jgi:short-subunit dehydrogenase
MPSAAFPVRGSVAVVTGAAGGIGRALALDLAAHGCSLALADLDEAGLATAAATARMSGVSVSEHVLDVADAASVSALPDAVLAVHGRVNLLVNNAGVALMGDFTQTSPEDFAWLFEINFWGTVRNTRAFLPVLRREPVAQIVNVSSIFGIVAPGGQTAYSASKFAVRGFSEALQHELETTGVGVSVVHPGGIATAIARNARVSVGIDRADAKRALELFTHLAITSPEQAAARIVTGILRREKRILIGRDARLLDALQRLLPTGYWPLIRKQTRQTLRLRLHSAPAPEQRHG